MTIIDGSHLFADGDLDYVNNLNEMRATTADILTNINSMTITAQYGAVGNGTTNDTAAFTALEVDFAGKEINLGGYTYKVTSVPRGCKYHNGAFRLDKTTTINTVVDSYTYDYPALLETPISPNVSLLRDARNPNSRLAYQLTLTAGVQSLAFDEVGKNIYTMHLTGTGAAEVSYISIYSMAASMPATASVVSSSNAQLGHQGLSIEYSSSSRKFWGSVRNSATYPTSGRQAIRFSAPTVSGSPITSIESYTLFGSEFAYTTNATIPAVSYDQRYLVAMGRKDSRNFWVRVFDLAYLASNGAGDYSNKWLYQFQIDRDILEDDAGLAFTPVQNMACDGAFVYMLAGNATLNGKRIVAYTIDGRRVGENRNVSVGITEATADGTFYEPEALAIHRPDGHAQPTLAMVILSGGSGARVNRIWTLGYGNPLVIYDGKRGVGMDDSPKADWHVSRQTSPATITGLSSNAVHIIQNDTGNVFSPVVISSTNGTIGEHCVGPAADYRNGRLTYTYGTTDQYWAIWAGNTAILYVQKIAGVKGVIPGTNEDVSLGTSGKTFSDGYIKNIRPGSVGNRIWTSGSGSPEGVLTALPGSMYTNENGGAGLTLYVKESGSGNTGWVAK